MSGAIKIGPERDFKGRLSEKRRVVINGILWKLPADHDPSAPAEMPDPILIPVGGWTKPTAEQRTWATVDLKNWFDLQRNEIKNAAGEITGYRFVKWSLHAEGYAYRTWNDDAGIHRSCRMHQQVMGHPSADGFVVDHQNGNRLDNREEVLHVKTVEENNHNKTVSRGSSQFVGVSQRKNRWVAKVRNHHLGTYSHELSAAVIADLGRKIILPGSFPSVVVASALNIATEDDIKEVRDAIEDFKIRHSYWAEHFTRVIPEL